MPRHVTLPRWTSAHAAVVALTALACLHAGATPTPVAFDDDDAVHAHRLHKRSTVDWSDAIGVADSITSRGYQVLANFGQSLQLNTLGLSNVNVEALLVPGADIVALAQQYFLGTAILFAFGLLMAIGVSVTGLLFLCCRLCCDRCGGRKPSRLGYTKKQMYLTAAFTLIFSILSIAFGAVVYVSSEAMAGAITSLANGSTLSFDGVAAFIDNFIATTDALPATLETGIVRLGSSIIEIDFSAVVGTYVLPVLGPILSSMAGITSNVQSIETNVNATQTLISAMSNDTTDLENLLATLSTQLDGIRSVTVEGLQYNISGVPTVPSTTFPNISALVDFDAVTGPLESVPDLTTLSNDLNGTYYNVTGSIGPIVNSTVGSALAEITGGVSLSSVFDSLSTGLVTPLTTAKTSVSSISETVYSLWGTVQQLNNYRFIATAVLLGLLFLALSLGFIGTVLRKGVIVQVLIPTAILFGAFFWLHYSVFFLVSAPLNMAGSLQETYLGQSIVINLNENTTINLGIGKVLQGCQNDESLFTLNINDDGDTFPSILNFDTYFYENSTYNRSENFIETLNITGMLGGFNFSSYVQIPLPDLSALDTVANTTISITGVDVNVSSPIDIATTQAGLQLTSDSLSPSTFKPDWTEQNVTDTLKAFNDLAVPIASNTSFSNYTYDFIVQEYIDGSSTFEPEQITLNPTHPQNNALNLTFIAAKSQVTFKYYANESITDLQTKIAAIQVTLASLSTTIDSIDSSKSTLETNLASIETSFNSTLDSITVINTQIDQFSTALDDLASGLVNSTIYAVESSLTTTYENLITSIISAGNCKSLSSGLVTLSSALTVELATVTNGIWTSSFFLALFLFPLFILGVKGSKRFGHPKVMDASGVKGDVMMQQAHPQSHPGYPPMPIANNLMQAPPPNQRAFSPAF